MTHEERVAAALKALDSIRPALQGDGGDVEYVSLKDDILYIKLIGACAGCPISSYTITFGIEEAVKKNDPSIKKVEAVE